MGNQGLRQHVEMSSKTGVFHLSKAKLQQFPPELITVIQVLRHIDLSENRIASIPENIGIFLNLKHLNLNHNQIEIIPDKLAELQKLETLSLSHNKIQRVPTNLSKLQKLRDVNLSDNLLATFPKVFCGLRSLSVLDLTRNRLTNVPSGVGDLNVVELILNQNMIKAVSEDLSRCPNLKTLRLEHNEITLQDFPTKILSDSPISLILIEGNKLDMKKFSELPGYGQYMERFTATKKKLT